MPDRNNDDKADMADIEVRLTGWGIQDRHETINSLHWGPDGWLYGLQGYATSSKIPEAGRQRPIYKAKEPFPNVMAGDGVEINGGVWRYHPTATSSRSSPTVSAIPGGSTTTRRASC